MNNVNNVKYQWRKTKNQIILATIAILAIIPAIPLFIILFQLFQKGISSLSIDFFLNLPAPPGEPGGGIKNAIVGTFIIVGLASLMGVPLSIMAGIYLSEYGKESKFAHLVRMCADIFQGVPSIVIGIIAYAWVVKPMGKFSALSGSVALAIMMIPVVVRTTEEVLRLVPNILREASLALGVPYWRTVLKVVLPTGMVGVTTGVLIAVARIAGETAPLLFTAFGNPFMTYNPLEPMNALPLLIFNYSMSPYEDWWQQAWGASIVLITIVLLLNIASRILARRVAGEK
ncbi:phosphate ABC transporter, inner membrane subunit PstA [Thermodesulfatator indicus DSM 15286]|uniref:Phosphate transport system permease protein PstA n=1 Tax=Thermodesulfatator indicus (strain DSM 15286 / JCM 11887 / CIR29812) TaxID=667014 RepID=F8A931_THEID|nr:phosphate ABC transporter permease PstA [Thermodesulfatator indicus]AEH45159.1 phosphate ABC transporter, inner membrane subunit PstA [Thermodesulfatator indicus DSM 15286]